MMSIRLPMDDAWEKVRFHTLQDDPGAVVVPLLIGPYALIATNDTDGESVIYIAAEFQEDVTELPLPAVEFGIGGKRYVAIPVKTADQAGAVVKIFGDCRRKSIPYVDAVRYIATRI